MVLSTIFSISFALRILRFEGFEAFYLRVGGLTSDNDYYVIKHTTTYNRMSFVIGREAADDYS